LDEESVKIADIEVEIAMYGERFPKSYEDQYQFIPWFCMVWPFVHIACYIGSVGNGASWSAPYAVVASGPQELYMMVYDSMCQDRRHEIWRLLTYQFAHGSLAHVLMNWIATWLAGLELEAVHGTGSIMKLYWLGVITGGVTAGAWSPHAWVLGSSGGVYTLIGARVANIIYNSEQMHKWLALRIFVLAAYFVQDVVSMTLGLGESTSAAAHAGGALCGVLYGGWVLRNFTPRPIEFWIVKAFRWLFIFYFTFCVAWYITQKSGAPQGIVPLDATGHCIFAP